MRLTGSAERSRQISPVSPTSPVSGSTSAIAMPGSGRPIEPGVTEIPGGLAMIAVISVWP